MAPLYPDRGSGKQSVSIRIHMKIHDILSLEVFVAGAGVARMSTCTVVILPARENIYVR